MKRNKMFLRITMIISLVVGFFCAFLISVTAQESHVQYGFLGFIIGFSIAWLVYLSLWFIGKGVARSAFPVQSAFIINGLKRVFNLHFTVYQEKMFLEVTGTLIMISVALGLAAAALIVMSGVLYIVGRLSW